MNEVTRILDAIGGGDPHAAGRLLPLVYDELRRLAARLKGGLTTQHQLARPVNRFEHLKEYQRLIARLKELHRQGLSVLGQNRFVRDFGRHKTPPTSPLSTQLVLSTA
jgi:hypothetical protein